MYRLPLPENANCVCRTCLKMKSQAWFKQWITVSIDMHKNRISNPGSCGGVKLPLPSVSVQDVEKLVHNGFPWQIPTQAQQGGRGRPICIPAHWSPPVGLLWQSSKREAAAGHAGGETTQTSGAAKKESKLPAGVPLFSPPRNSLVSSDLGQTEENK